MSFISDITNELTGGQNKKSEETLRNILNQIEAIKTPTAQDLQLSPLDQYAVTGELAPAVAQAAQAGPSAFDSEKLSDVPMSTMQQVLAQEMGIANANGMTPQERARIAQAEEDMNRNVAGQRGAIAQDFAGRGIPASLISAALQNGSVGQQAQQGYMNSLEAEANAANNAETARSNAGNLAGNMQSLQANQANTVAAASNALNQFNAANTQQANLANQNNAMTANVYNTQNKQGIANQNVSGSQARQIQNQVEAPQQATQLALEKGNELMGIGNSLSNKQTSIGQQNAGTSAGLIRAGGVLAGAAGVPVVPQVLGAMGGPIPTGKAHGGEIQAENVPATNFLEGGQVPGKPIVSGDSAVNDTVPARLSPGEVVIPRTVVQNPRNLGSFLAHKAPTMAANMAAHPSDIASIMKALSLLRGGTA